MKRAYELIVEFDTPLKDVGAMVGYFDLAHFYKTFKKHFGKTPGEFKKRQYNNSLGENAIFFHFCYTVIVANPPNTL